MSWFGIDRTKPVSAAEALSGRPQPLITPEFHAVFPDRRIKPPFPNRLRTAVFAMGCFWGAERLFWETQGVYSTAAGYAGGFTENPTYEEVCTAKTGHAEAVLVVYDPREVSYEKLLRVFWEGHDPTQGMRQGNDIGTEYRSAVYYQDEEQRAEAETSRESFQKALNGAGLGTITTEFAPLKAFYYAEGYHQQYLYKNPNGYCGLGGTGVSCPIGLGVRES